MPDPQIASRLATLDKFLAKVASLPDGDETKSYLCRFGTVLICGNIEQSFQIVIFNRLKPKAHDHVLNFIRSYFKRGQNLDCEAIQQLLGRFDTGWQREFTRFVESNPDVKEGIASCYSIRNSTAHGGTQSLGPRRLVELYELHKRLIDAFTAATKNWAHG